MDRHMASKLKFTARHGLELNEIFRVCSDGVVQLCMSKVPLAICPQRSFAEDHTVLRPMLGVWECLSSQIKLAPNPNLDVLCKEYKKCWRVKLHNICIFVRQNAFDLSLIFVNPFQSVIFGFSF